MELQVGPSDQWELNDEYLQIEQLAWNMLAFTPQLAMQPKHHVDHIYTKWIEFAEAAGDPTVLMYTDGRHIHPEFVTYHHLAEENQDKEVELAGEAKLTPAAKKKPAKRAAKKK
jgi:hypothetical protein